MQPKDEVVVKVRVTRYRDTWSFPTDPASLDEFLHGSPWTELHIIFFETKEVTAMYTREEFIQMMVLAKLGKILTKRSRATKATVAIVGCLQ